MAKELPYYQFEVAEYLAGDIMVCSLEAQGLYSIIKCLYWQKECVLNTKQVLRRYNQPDLIKELEEENCIKVDNKGFITISFLLSQYQSFKERRRKLSEAGSKGGRSKKKATLKPSLILDKATPKHIEENREEERKEEYILKDKIKTKKKLNIWFCKLWEEQRLVRYPKEKVYLKTIPEPLISDLKELYDSIDIEPQEEIKVALTALFKQKEILSNSMHDNPKHFIANYVTYRQAYDNKNASVYGIKQKENKL